ncbi:hypothetical protein PR048_010871 [Dryococelus australis]|uniref:Endonuclease/exonuclease/phosphatase domain-containing protein n=1 Tax=Dryococelus australis TaxID=614101 RepID=A0ABQ9I4Z5_9NEOP|nr:hypothetical protein PR048_010871 [Dryococelus australis]
MIHFLVWNARSSLHKSQDISLNLQFLTSPRPGSNDTKFTIPGYTIYRTDREGAPQGGVAPLIRNDITHYPRMITPFNDLEALAVRITNWQCSYNSRGDFNTQHAHWGCHNTTFRGCGLYNLILNQHLKISAFDLVISTTNIQFFNTPSLTHLDSDKLTVITTFNPIFTEIPHHHYRYNFHKADWKLFKSTLDSSINLTELPRTPEQLDQAIATFTESIRYATNIYILRRHPPHRGLPCPP